MGASGTRRLGRWMRAATRPALVAGIAVVVLCGCEPGGQGPQPATTSPVSAGGGSTWRPM